MTQIKMTAHGGRREGAGRKPGTSNGPKRPPNIRQIARERVNDVLATSRDPLAVLLEIANDQGVEVQIRVQAATAAAPFVFPKLSAAVVATAPASARENTAALVDRLMHRFARIAAPALTIEAELAAAPATVDADHGETTAPNAPDAE